MYDTIRRIHLYTGVALLAFVVMYFVTGYVLIHHELVSDERPANSTREEALTAAPGASPEEYSAKLQRQFAMAGKRQPPVRMRDGSWKFEYFRPGVGYKALVAPSGDKVRITTSPSSPRQTLVQFHRMHGYGGGWLYDLWCVVYDLASLSMILFALSGIYLWYKLTKRRLLGWMVLAVSFSFATGTILYLVHAA